MKGKEKKNGVVYVGGRKNGDWWGICWRKKK